jgi:hypothetical protein
VLCGVCGDVTVLCDAIRILCALLFAVLLEVRTCWSKGRSPRVPHTLATYYTAHTVKKRTSGHATPLEKSKNNVTVRVTVHPMAKHGKHQKNNTHTEAYKSRTALTTTSESRHGPHLGRHEKGCQ